MGEAITSWSFIVLLYTSETHSANYTGDWMWISWPFVGFSYAFILWRSPGSQILQVKRIHCPWFMQCSRGLLAINQKRSSLLILMSHGTQERFMPKLACPVPVQWKPEVFAALSSCQLSGASRALDLFEFLDSRLCLHALSLCLASKLSSDEGECYWEFRWQFHCGTSTVPQCLSYLGTEFQRD